MNKDKTLSDKIQIAFVFTDLAVVIGNEIDFFGRNSTLTGHANVGDAISLAGVTYDDTTKTMYLSDVDNKDVAIFSIDLTEKENFTMTSLLKKEDGMHIMGIVFDKESRTLFWADALNETIAKMHVSQSGEPSSPVVLHNLAGNSPRGVALDVCNRCAICDILRHGDSSSPSLISSHSPSDNRKKT